MKKGVENRPRGPNFSNEEMDFLLDLISKYKNIVECKQTDVSTNRFKEGTWQKITNEFNAKHCSRSIESIKSWWKNFKTATKANTADMRREKFKTGGGESNLSTNSLFDKASSIMTEIEVKGLFNPFDSDNKGDLNKGNDDKNNIGSMIEDILEISDDDDDPTQVFKYMQETGEIANWKSWNPNTLKTKISPPLQSTVPSPGCSKVNNTPRCVKVNNEKIETQKAKKTKQKIDEKNEKPKKICKKSDFEYKEKLSDILNNYYQEKKDYEIELYKVKIENKLLHSEWLKMQINKEKGENAAENKDSPSAS